MSKIDLITELEKMITPKVSDFGFPYEPDGVFAYRIHLNLLFVDYFKDVDSQIDKLYAEGRIKNIVSLIADKRNRFDALKNSIIEWDKHCRNNGTFISVFKFID